jgi:hypothetical protein
MPGLSGFPQSQSIPQISGQHPHYAADNPHLPGNNRISGFALDNPKGTPCELSGESRKGMEYGLFFVNGVST